MNFLGILIALAFLASAEILHAGQGAIYFDGKVELEGYIAKPAGALKKKLPAVLVVHAWTGLDEYAKRRSDQLASLGYVALAADMYGKGIRAKDHVEAAKLSGVQRSDRVLMRRRIRAAFEYLSKVKEVDVNRIFAIGYCFGGGAVLELARSGAPVRGVASFHGNLDTPMPAKVGEIKARVLVLNGAADPHVKPNEIEKFREEMEAAKVDWEFVNYGGALHSFTDFTRRDHPLDDIAYSERADRRSWKALISFFDESQSNP